MVVDKHLKELALSNRRVIIPDLGAFLSKEGDGDEKNLIFSSFLKYNDGFLEKQLAEKEKISQTQATEEIKKFVEEVTKTLRAKQNYVIANFGFFHMDERGSIAFAPQGTEVPVKSVEEKPIVAPPAVTTALTTPKEDTVQKPETTVTTPTPPKAVESKAEQPKVEQTTVKPLIPQQTAPLTTPPSNPVPPKQTPPAKQQSAKKSSNNGLLITIVVLLLVIIALLLLYFMVPSIKEKVNSMFGIGTTTEQVITTPTPIVDSIPAADTTKQEVIATTTESTEKDEISTPKTTSTYGSNYYVIVGTFQEKSNADKMYKRCIADGYDAELLPKMGPLYPVSIFNSPSKAECTKVMREAQRKYGDAWVFKSRRR